MVRGPWITGEIPSGIFGPGELYQSHTIEESIQIQGFISNGKGGGKEVM
jgi:hypothetical protein